MRINRICKICGNKFVAIKITQFFCCRKCFKKDYYLRTRDRSQEGENQPKYPFKTCLFCEERSQLDFDPVHSPEKFNAWGCPHCGATNKLIWDHQHDYNSYQVISDILVSMEFNTMNFEKNIPQFQTFRLPVLRPGQVNNTILVMSCEPMGDFSEIQKGKNKKKLLFS